MEATMVKPQTLAEKYETIKILHPKSRIREHAQLLGVSEASLVALGAGHHVTALKAGEDCKDILREAEKLGRVMALTRNEHAVHERKGVYRNVSFDNHVGLVLDEEIDLRLFMHCWHHAFAVHENDRKSLQFFDETGTAVHKIYLTPHSNLQAYEALVEKYALEAYEGNMETQVLPQPDAPKADAAVDLNAFHAAWKAMTDTHQFFGILRRHGLQREQALRLAPEGYVTKVDNQTAEAMLNHCAAHAIPIMVFVANRGCIQIHSGPVQKLVRTGPWYNVLDPEFNLHLRTDAIANSYVVRKPSEDGTIHSLELFDKDGNMIIQFFGKRKPGIPEIKAWSDLLNGFPSI
jgi:putative hemin transport protein